MSHVTWRGVTVDARTAAMLAELDRLVGPRIPIHPTQGSYSNGSLSAGTHTGGGAVDLSVLHPRELSAEEILTIVRCARIVGFAAWWRREPEWHEGQHIHMIAVGCPDLAAGAARQVEDLRRGRNGLVNELPDRHAGMHLPVVTWEHYTASKAVAARKRAAALAAVAAAAAAALHGAPALKPAAAPVAKPTVVKPVAAAPAVAKPAAKHAAPGPAKTVSLSKDVRPGRHAAQVHLLKSLLVRDGYGPITGAALRSDLYGTATEAAVGRFYRAHPEFAGKRGDVAIGPAGFAFLQSSKAAKR